MWDPHPGARVAPRPPPPPRPWWELLADGDERAAGGAESKAPAEAEEPDLHLALAREAELILRGVAARRHEARTAYAVAQHNAAWVSGPARRMRALHPPVLCASGSCRGWFSGERAPLDLVPLVTMASLEALLQNLVAHRLLVLRAETPAEAAARRAFETRPAARAADPLDVQPEPARSRAEINHVVVAEFRRRRARHRRLRAAWAAVEADRPARVELVDRAAAAWPGPPADRGPHLCLCEQVYFCSLRCALLSGVGGIDHALVCG